MSAKQKELTGRHVLMITIGAFAVVFAVNALFITLSLETFTGEDVPDAYSRGLAYNEIIEERADQAALGWTVAFSAALEDDGLTHVAVDLADAEGTPIGGANISILFRRPTHDGEDTPLALTEAGAGTYTGIADLPGDGLWHVRGRADRDEGERLDFEERLWVE